jgi:monoterpene epsilon-lactone hydrolase
MQSLKSRLHYHLLRRALAKFRRLKLPIAQGRLERERQSARLFKKPQGLVIDPCTLGGVSGDWLRPDTVEGPESVVLYLHGGAYVFGSNITHRGLASGLAIASSAHLLLINYRLAPEHPFPAALDDAFAVYVALLEANPDACIALAGDSAGGGLAVALALRIRDAGLKPPQALALMSPWTDLTMGNPTHRSKASGDPYFPDSSLLKTAAQAYASDTALAHPLVSPQFADLSRLPPSLIHVGEREALLDDSRLLAQRMTAAGSSVTLVVYAGMWHVWQTFVGRFSEADASIVSLGGFLQQQLRSPQDARLRESPPAAAS